MSPIAKDTTWKPLLFEDEAERAIAAAEEIAAELRRRMDPSEPLPMGRTHFSLSGGWAGQALLFAYLDQVRPEQGHGDTAMEMLELAFEDLGRNQAPPGLYSGLTGVAWTMEHFRGCLFEDDEGEDSGAEIAERLSGLLSGRPWILGYDVTSGLVGFGVYALERLPLPFGRECVERALAALGELAERGPDGISWWTAENSLASTLDFGTSGHYNLGTAHGVPGIIGWLGQVCASGIAAEEARELLEGTVRWFLARHNPVEFQACFPIAVVPEREESGKEEPSRLAWCYGDTGVAAALCTAALGAGEPRWLEAALEVAHKAARRPRETTSVIDPGLCHGAAGNAHLFNRCWQATGDPECAAAARFWISDALAMRRPGEGIAGFRTWNPGIGGEKGWCADPGFLTGGAGIGLALLAAASSVEPAWDRLLLAS